MPKVLVLPDYIASQIAAGEVVERPASVVKELVENSIDAGATQIEIAVSSECRDIRIADNGCGMEADDAVLAFHRHATSKIASADDLWSLRTMGFRGEALPSISSVSHMTCYTRTAEGSSGTKVEAAEGKVITTETGCAPGTVMEINDLFYNVPARMKFLKKPATEFAHIHEIVQSLAVAHPKIVFQLLNNGTVVMKTSGSGKLAQAMLESGILTGKEELLPVAYAEMKNEMAIYGYIARPTHFRGDRKGILSIVNNRPVRCPLTYKALEYAYSDLIPRGKHPIAVITLTTDPRQVDVNVHPTKKEIKYSNGNDVYMALQRAISQAARTADLHAETAVESSVATPEYAQVTAGSPTPLAREHTAGGGFSATPQRPSSEQLHFSERLSYVPPVSRSSASAVTPALPANSRTPASLPSGWRLLGYLHNTYILVETPEGLEIIEQHIAHERTLYEQVLAAQETPGRTADHSQRLVISVPLNLTPQQTDRVKEHLTPLQKLGFDFEFQGPDNATVICTQVPLQLAHKDYASTVQQIIEDLNLTESAALELEATKSIACQAAIKNGMPLSESDIVQLIYGWHNTPRNDTCPHGRPVRLKYSMDKLFQLFHPA